MANPPRLSHRSFTRSPFGTKRTFYVCRRISVLGRKAVMQRMSPQRPMLTQCMVRPCVAREFLRVGGCAVLHQCIRPLIGAFRAPGHHGYQRACDLVSGQVSTGHLGHQYSQAPGRPILHLVFVLSQTSAGKTFRRSVTDHATCSLLASNARPRARTLQAMRASLLASAIARTL